MAARSELAGSTLAPSAPAKATCSSHLSYSFALTNVNVTILDDDHGAVNLVGDVIDLLAVPVRSSSLWMGRFAAAMVSVWSWILDKPRQRQLRAKHAELTRRKRPRASRRR